MRKLVKYNLFPIIAIAISVAGFFYLLQLNKKQIVEFSEQQSHIENMRKDFFANLQNVTRQQQQEVQHDKFLALESLIQSAEIAMHFNIKLCNKYLLQAKSYAAINNLQSLVSSIESLQFPSNKDLYKVWVAVDWLQMHVDNLPEQKQMITKYSNNNWRSNLKNIFKDSIKLRKVNVDPAIDSLNILLRKQQLSIMLEHLRWAALHRNEEIFQQSLSNINYSLTNNFMQQDEQLQIYRDKVEELARINFPKLPSFDPVYQSLNFYREH